MKGLFSAIGFLTIIPVRKQDISSVTMIFFPVVGLFLGGVILFIHFLITRFFNLNISVIAVLLLSIYIILTGGFHIDGLSDTIDGILSGGDDKTKILSVMNDAHIGAGGTIAIVLDILIKFVLFTEVVKSSRAWILLLIFPVISRWAMVFSMILSNPAKDVGLGKLFIENTKPWNFVIATLLSIGVCLLIYPSVTTILAIFIVCIVVIIFTSYFKKKIGGMTGDTFGAINEITEIIPLLVLKSV